MAIKSVTTDILIIGGGPAGLTAALYAARAGRKTLILSGRGSSHLAAGYDVQNYPGFPSIDSRDLLKKFRDHARLFGAELIDADATDFSLDSTPKSAVTRDLFVQAAAVIIATGKPFLRERMIPGEERLLGTGVSYCTTCDGPFYRGQPVAAWGDSEEAADDVLALDQMGCRPIWIPGEKNVLKAPSRLVEAIADKNIPVYFKTKVKRVEGEERLERIIIEREGKEVALDAAALFIFREGLNSPLLLRAGLKLDHRQCIAVDRSQSTNLEGVFAAGDVTCGGMQVVTACGEGAVAAMRAIQYLRRLQA